MSKDNIISLLVCEADESNSGEYFDFTACIARLLHKNLYEQLSQLVNGPVHDGDVISKSCRDHLLELGLAVRICVQGEQGYTGAKYVAFSVDKVIKEIQSGKRG